MIRIDTDTRQEIDEMLTANPNNPGQHHYKCDCQECADLNETDLHDGDDW